MCGACSILPSTCSRTNSLNIIISTRVYLWKTSVYHKRNAPTSILLPLSKLKMHERTVYVYGRFIILQCKCRYILACNYTTVCQHATTLYCMYHVIMLFGNVNKTKKNILVVLCTIAKFTVMPLLWSCELRLAKAKLPPPVDRSKICTNNAFQLGSSLLSPLALVLHQSPVIVFDLHLLLPGGSISTICYNHLTIVFRYAQTSSIIFLSFTPLLCNHHSDCSVSVFVLDSVFPCPRIHLNILILFASNLFLVAARQNT